MFSVQPTSADLQMLQASKIAKTARSNQAVDVDKATDIEHLASYDQPSPKPVTHSSFLRALSHYLTLGPNY